MSYFPNVRTKKVEQLFHHILADAEVNNEYYQGNLDDEGKQFIRGFDWCMEMVVGNLFGNLDIYSEDFERIGLDALELNTDIVNSDVPYAYNALDDAQEEPSEEYKDIDDYTDEDIAKMSDITKIALLIKSILFQYGEGERNELITSMLEDCGEGRE